MARGATVVVFDIELSDVDRGVYESLSLQAAQHPSESAAYLVTRVLAYALEYAEGIEFSQGLFAADEPAVWIKDLTGQLLCSIELGAPDPARLHKASKASDRVVVYGFKEWSPWLRTLATAKVHAPERIRLRQLDPRDIEALSQRIGRRNAWSLSVVDGAIYLEVDDEPVPIGLTDVPWPS